MEGGVRGKEGEGGQQVGGTSGEEEVVAETGGKRVGGE